MANHTEEDLKKILTEQSAHPLLAHVHADPELNGLCTSIGAGISELLEIIKSEELAPATISRLQMVVVDGGALLAACVASPNAAAIPASLVSQIDTWTSWVENLSAEMAARKDASGRT